jgi:hypothetical protein
VKLIGSPEVAEVVGPLMQAVSSAALTGEALDKEAWGQNMGALLRTAREDLLSPRDATTAEVTYNRRFQAASVPEQATAAEATVRAECRKADERARG